MLQTINTYINLKFWLFQTVAMMITALLIPKLRITSIFGALGVVVALAFVNGHLWDAALFFQVPDSLTTQSLVLVVCNGILFLILVKLLPGIEVEGILPAIIAPIVFSVCNILVSKYAPLVDWQALWILLEKGMAAVKQQVGSTS